MRGKTSSQNRHSQMRGESDPIFLRCVEYIRGGARPWHDGDLLGYAYAYEQATHHRHPPVLVEQGLLTQTP